MEEVGRTRSAGDRNCGGGADSGSGLGQEFRPAGGGDLPSRAENSTLGCPLSVDEETARREVTRRMAAQFPDEEKIKAADYVIDNSGSLDETRKQVGEVYGELKNMAEDQGHSPQRTRSTCAST